MPSGHRGKRAFPYGSESLCPHPSVIGGTRMSLLAEVAVVGGSVAGRRVLGRWVAGRAGGLREGRSHLLSAALACGRRLVALC